jgi:hypothetical protein
MEPIFDQLLEKIEKSGKHDYPEEFALRHPTFDNQKNPFIACFYFARAGGGIGCTHLRYVTPHSTISPPD